jgi:hypothetical protein
MQRRRVWFAVLGLLAASCNSYPKQTSPKPGSGYVITGFVSQWVPTSDHAGYATMIVHNNSDETVKFRCTLTVKTEKTQAKIDDDAELVGGQNLSWGADLEIEGDLAKNVNVTDVTCLRLPDLVP